MFTPTNLIELNQLLSKIYKIYSKTWENEEKVVGAIISYHPLNQIRKLQFELITYDFTSCKFDGKNFLWHFTHTKNKYIDQNQLGLSNMEHEFTFFTFTCIMKLIIMIHGTIKYWFNFPFGSLLIDNNFLWFRICLIMN